MMAQNKNITKEMMETKYTEIIKNLINEKWGFLEENWNTVSKKYKHRTEIKKIDKIQDVKQKVLDKLGHIGIFFFFNIILH